MTDTTKRRHRRAQPLTGDAMLLDGLGRLAELICRSAEWGSPPQLVFIAAGGDDFEVGVRPLDPGADLIATLAGFRAPQSWDVFGVCCGGKAHLVDDEPRRDGADPVRIAHLVHRSGAHASSLCSELGEMTSPDGPVVGRIDDLLRRALDLPTDPPAFDGLDWRELRADCVVGEHQIAGVSPALATWFDDGSFSRWVLGEAWRRHPSP